MANQKGPLLLLLGLVLSSASCSYVKNRTNDLLDVFWLDVDVGMWPSVDVQASDWFGVGLGYSHQGIPLVNWHGRHVGHIERRILAVGAVAAFTDYSNDWMVPALPGSGDYDTNVQSPPNIAAFVPTYFVKEYDPSARGLRVADVGVGAAAIVGVWVGFSPGEFLDFVLGIVGVDIGDDDRFPLGTAEAVPEVPK